MNRLVSWQDLALPLLLLAYFLFLSLYWLQPLSRTRIAGINSPRFLHIGSNFPPSKGYARVPRSAMCWPRISDRFIGQTGCCNLARPYVYVRQERCTKPSAIIFARSLSEQTNKLLPTLSTNRQTNNSTSNMYSKITTALAGICMLSSASAAAIASRQSDYVWNVSGLTVYCADDGCSYLFNIEGPKVSEQNIPGFTAQCRAQVGPMQTTYHPCDIGLNEDGGPRPMSVEAYFNLDGTNFYQSELSVQMTYPDLSLVSNPCKDNGWKILTDHQQWRAVRYHFDGCG